jgi:head-tail adaptor
MRAGQLRHRIALQAASEAQDAVGQPIAAWSTVGTFWGLYRNLTGREATVARQVVAAASGAVTLRNVPVAITERHRLAFDGHLFGVVNVNDRGAGDGKKRCYELLVEEIR